MSYCKNTRLTKLNTKMKTRDKITLMNLHEKSIDHARKLKVQLCR